jgi:DNA-binding transcriptional MocR family regulator
VPGGLCYADDATRAKPDHEMRISFGSATEKEICAGVARLGAVLHKILNREKNRKPSERFP